MIHTPYNSATAYELRVSVIGDPLLGVVMEFETEELKALAASGRERGYLTFDAVAEAVSDLDISRG